MVKGKTSKMKSYKRSYRATTKNIFTQTKSQRNSNL